VFLKRGDITSLDVGFPDQGERECALRGDLSLCAEISKPVDVNRDEITRTYRVSVNRLARGEKVGAFRYKTLEPLRERSLIGVELLLRSEIRSYGGGAAPISFKLLSRRGVLNAPLKNQCR
jgi:hypothetical protein